MTEETKMSKEEILTALEFGKNIVAEYNARNEKVPAFVYERIIDLQDQLIELLSK